MAIEKSNQLLAQISLYAHETHLGLVDLDLVRSVPLDGLRLSESDGARGRVGEDDGGNVLVVEELVLELLATEKPVRQPPASGDSDGGKEGLASDVTDGKDAVDIGRLELVERDVTLCIRLDADGLEIDVLGESVTADRPKNAVDLNSLARVKVKRERARGSILGDLLDVGLAVDVDARVLHVLGERVLNDRVEGTEDLIVTDNIVRLGPETMEELSSEIMRT